MAKYYVVWKGREKGVFNSWEECKKQTQGFPGAWYKSFKSLDLAKEAFTKSYAAYKGKDYSRTPLSEMELKLIGKPIMKSISVDGAWNTKSGVVEYQGVDSKTKELLFHQGPFDDGTINIVEFLALVHALAYAKKNNIELSIYSDSSVAIGWINDGKHRSQHEKSDENQKLFDMLSRAELWLRNNTYSNKILKWETKAWGEIPADFGRK